jgi:hypothetical protein
MLSGMGDGQEPREVLAGNIAAAMARRRLGHAGLAERMQDLGFKWIRQTVGDVLSGRRSLRAAELYGLALALEMPVQRLVIPDDDVRAISLPNGRPVLAKAVTMGAAAMWDGNKLVRLSGDTAWQDGETPDPLRSAVELDARHEDG